MAEAIDQTYFNASKFEPERVAELFVSNEHLYELLAKDNAILTGPRGSGKTTLMKMLTRQALDKWDHPRSRELIEYPVLSIYIGSDTVSKSQFSEAEKHALAASELSALNSIGRSKLAIHILDTLLTALRHELDQGRARIEGDAITRCCRSLAGLYKIAVPYPSLDALLEAIPETIIDLSEAIQSAGDGDCAGLAPIARRHNVASLADLLTRTHQTVSAAFTGVPSKWILLFDDLEYLSDRSRNEVLGLVRALGPAFGLKIAMTPLSMTRSYLSDIENKFLNAGHDYLPISLSPGGAKELLRFAEELHSRILSRVYRDHGLSLPEFYGVSAFAPLTAKYRQRVVETVSRPSDESLISELAAESSRFREYAKDKKLLELSLLTPAQRAGRFRKALPVMLLWRERLKEGADEDDKRSRKTRQLYTGYPTFLELSDGNPRSILRMLDHVLKEALSAGQREVQHDRSGRAQGFFEPHWQVSAADTESMFQESLAGAYLCVHDKVYGELFALDLLHEIATTFQSETFDRDKFNPEPPNSFVVDGRLPERVGLAIVDAVYTGVLVELSPDARRHRHDVIRAGSDLVGRKFRLSHLSCAQYWLPMRQGRALHLSTLLDRIVERSARPGPRHGRRRRRVSGWESTVQEEMF